jgi:prepilin-type N-terminal cleavage/methylation domain-containing protein/prepilin-type processing-associated H-X9-DG protein
MAERTLSRPPGRAFSLLELLVTTTIIGVLLALLLPAVQSAREAARQVGCCNNFRQIGVALQNYHAAHGSFPPGGIEHRAMLNPKTGMTYGPAGRQLAWSVFLLPYLEQDSLYRQLDLEEAFDSPQNAPAAATVLGIYVCPSTPHGAELKQGRGPCQYGGIYGERITGPNHPPKGVMLYDRAISLAEIPDGASNTLIVSEDCNNPDGQWINGLNVFDQAFAINRAPAYENDIASRHPNGANGSFGDGSARFLSENIDLVVLAALCTRAGGESIQPP